MKKANRFSKILLLGAVLFLTSFVVSTALVHRAAAQSTFQTWQMVVTISGSSHSGTLYVLSDGDFTSSGFTGSTSQGSYEISVEGSMSGTSVTLTETASYDSGNGYIYASGDGTLNAAFPYATSAFDGTISGTISDPLGERSFSGTWTATKTSGGTGGDGYSSDFSNSLGDMTPFLVLVGTAVAIGGTVFGIRHVVNSRRSNIQQLGGKTEKIGPTPSAPFIAGKVTAHHEWAAQPAVDASPTPPTINTIQPGGTPISGPGASVAPVDLGTLPFLNATWQQAGVFLAWGEPQYDKTRYILQGYNVIQRIYGPLSNASQNGTTTFVPAGQPNTPTGTFRPFTQTHTFNTGGDVAGFRVDPVFQSQSTGQVFTNPPSGLGIRIGEPFGTFGVGP